MRAAQSTARSVSASLDASKPYYLTSIDSGFLLFFITVNCELSTVNYSSISGTSPKQSWLNRTVLGVGLTSLFSDWSHETATAVLPAFLAAIGAGPAWLGAIEGIADGLSSFAKLASGHYTDRLKHRKPLA